LSSVNNFVFLGLKLIKMKESMKKLLLMLTAATLLFVSCQGPAGRDGLDGLDGKDFEFYVENFTIRSQDWRYVNSGRYTSLYEYVAEVDVSEDAYERGIVNVYLFQWNTGSNSEVQTPLPYWTQHTVGDNTWLEGYNYDFDKGTIAFYVEIEKGTTPPTCSFRVAIAP
jgi:hypothetical protein